MSGLIDLRPDQLAIVEGILAEHMPDCEVRAFGSRATWTAKDYSDLDLAVVGHGPLDRRTLGRLKEAFEESILPMRVDVVDWHAITDSFRQTIEPDCVVIHEFPRQAATRARAGLSETAIPDDSGSYSTIGEFAPFLYGKSLPKRQRNPQGHARVYGSNGIVGHHDTALTSGPTIIIGRKGTVGAVHYSPDPCWPIDTTFFVEGDDPLLHRFKYYALKAADLLNMNADSAVPGLNRNEAHAKRIYVPPVAEQHSIAHVLGALDDKIELNRRMSETLDAMGRALFRSWFVDFDPVRSKAKGRPSDLPTDLDILFPDSFNSSELGDIPTGWQVQSLNSIATFTNGLALQRFPPNGDSWLPVIKIPEMRRGFTDRSAKASADIDPRFVVEDGDVVFSWSGSLEAVLWAHGRGALNQHLFKVTSREFPRWFYWNWTREHLDSFRGIAASKATTMGHIQRHHLEEARVVVPPDRILCSNDVPLRDMTEQQVRYAVESRTLAGLRDTLLPMLLSGELRVRGAEQPPAPTPA